MSALIEVDRVCKSFGGLQALRECSLDVPHGSITGVIIGQQFIFSGIHGIYSIPLVATAEGTTKSFDTTAARRGRVLIAL